MDMPFQALAHLHGGDLLVAGMAFVVVLLALCRQNVCDRLVAIIRACRERCGCDSCASHRHSGKRKRRSR